MVAAIVAALGSRSRALRLISWIISSPQPARERDRRASRRYGTGDLSPSRLDYGPDELGAVARVLDASVQELGRQLHELSRDRARMEAILSGMIEGVLVVDARAAAAGQRGRAGDAADGRLGDRPALRGSHPPSRHRRAAWPRRCAGATPTIASWRCRAIPATRSWRAPRPVRRAAADGAVLVLHDITDLRRADQIRRDFVANVSHELRTPLTAIRGYVEALLDDRPDADESDAFLEIIARHTARMERLVSDLLRLARLDAKQEALDLTSCDVRQLFRAWSATSRRRSNRSARRSPPPSRRARPARRPGQAARRAPQPGRERGELLAGGGDDSPASRPPRRRHYHRRVRFRTGHSASISRAYSNASIASTNRDRAPAARASASPSSSISSSCMAASRAENRAERRHPRHHHAAARRPTAGLTPLAPGPASR